LAPKRYQPRITPNFPTVLRFVTRDINPLRCGYHSRLATA
jgi:hypothetical protein